MRSEPRGKAREGATGARALIVGYEETGRIAIAFDKATGSAARRSGLATPSPKGDQSTSPSSKLFSKGLKAAQSI